MIYLKNGFVVVFVISVVMIFYFHVSINSSNPPASDMVTFNDDYICAVKKSIAEAPPIKNYLIDINICFVVFVFELRASLKRSHNAYAFPFLKITDKPTSKITQYPLLPHPNLKVYSEN